MAALQDSLREDQAFTLINNLSQLPTYTIGRKPDNAIVITNAKVSGHHARLIQCTTDSFVIEDFDSKNGTFVNGQRITRKVIGKLDTIKLADTGYPVEQLLASLSTKTTAPTAPTPPKPPITQPTPTTRQNPQDFTREFTALRQVFDQYPKLRRDCRNREKMIRTGSVILSSIVGVSAAVATGGGALPVIHLLSGAGLSMLIPTLCSSLLSTDEKLEIIDKEYREKYRCPNPTCRDPFGMREWELLAQQKTCRRCRAIWVS